MEEHPNIIKIQNIDLYTQEIIDGTLILTLKRNYVSEDILLSKDLTNSNITYCKLNNIDLKKLKYKSILIQIYKDMPTNQILQNTTFNFKLNNINGEDGYVWCNDIKMSMQNKDANGTIIEIIKMLKLMHYKFEIGIKLKDNQIIYYKTDY